ncbi:hypothetical protein OROHE_008676 [Orobanche hederae]
MKIEELKEYEYCLPYFYNPLPEDELLQSTEVSIVFPMDPKPILLQIISEFDWELDRVVTCSINYDVYQEYTNQLIEDEVLPADQKESFKKFVKEKVRDAKKANREAREAREKALADMSDETRAAFENMKFYKFYPLPTADSPDVVKLDAIKKMKIEELKEYEYYLPYFYNPLPEDELLQSTEVSIIFPMDPKPIISEFDWELDRVETCSINYDVYQEYTNQLIEDEVLPADQKESFKKFVKEKVRDAKKANREAREAREKALANMSDETRAAFENMKFYKFYPLPTADSPDVVKALPRFGKEEELAREPYAKEGRA